jgi:hypothetical protein
MRILTLAASAAAVLLPASAAQAQYYGRNDYRDYREYQRDVRQERRECERELRRADTRREYRQELRECRRELRQARRDYRRDLRDNDYAYNRHGHYNQGYSYGYRQPYHGSRYVDPRLYWDGYQWRYRY